MRNRKPVVREEKEADLEESGWNPYYTGLSEAISHLKQHSSPYMRKHLEETPARVSRSWEEMFSGILSDPDSFVLNALTPSPGSQMIIVRDIDMVSICAHHLLPFSGRVHVGYIPKGSIVGLSKIPRVVEAYARRPQVQENLTEEIADCLFRTLDPQGVGVMIQAVHQCMLLRGVKKKGEMVTCALRGKFLNDPSVKAEFVSWLKIR